MVASLEVSIDFCSLVLDLDAVKTRAFLKFLAGVFRLEAYFAIRAAKENEFREKDYNISGKKGEGGLFFCWNKMFFGKNKTCERKRLVVL